MLDTLLPHLLLLESALCFLLSLWIYLSRSPRGVDTHLGLLIFCFLLLLSRLYPGRDILAPGFFAPASLPCRFVFLSEFIRSSASLRRALEPCLIFGLSQLLALALCYRTKLTAVSVLSFSCLVIVEVLALSPIFRAFIFASASSLAQWNILSFCLSQIFIGSLISSLIFLLSRQAKQTACLKALFAGLSAPLCFLCFYNSDNLRSLRLLSLLCFLLIGFYLRPQISRKPDCKTPAVRLGQALMLSLSIVFAALCVTTLTPPQSLIVGAHFYSWFPENWKAGYFGAFSSPRIEPELGLYQSKHDAVFARQLGDMQSAGINTVIFDWWPHNFKVRGRALEHMNSFKANSPLKFALLYETLALHSAPQEAGKLADNLLLDKQAEDFFVADITELAEGVMQNPQYLRIDNRPVVFLYATRHLLGDFRQMLERTREEVRKRFGLELYFVADEAYFNVLSLNRKGAPIMLEQYQANWERLSAVDAITCYNPYDESKPQHGGEQGIRQFLLDSAEMFKHYSAVANTLGIEFIPTALSGYNDQGIRPAAKHFIIPRSTAEFAETLSATLKLWVKPQLDRHYPFFTVTSWNEWNEGTQIEPAREQAVPEGETVIEYGEKYRGYGKEKLEKLRATLRELLSRAEKLD